MNNFFTIIICFKNPDLSFFDNCLDSLKKQKYKYFNCVFVDDGSNKNINYHEFIKSKIGDVSYIYHENKTNLGLGVSRNIGVELSLGSHILFLDADDFLTLDCLSYLNKKINEYNDVDLICFDYVEHYTPSYESKTKMVYEKDIKEELFLNEPSKKLKRFLFDKFQTDWRYCYSKNFLIENNIQHKDENIYFEDVIFNLHCKNCFNKILCTTKKLYFYNRLNLSSIVRNFNSHQSAQLILNNLNWIYTILKSNYVLNKNFYFYIIYFFRQFVLINNDQQNWILLKELTKKNKFISLKYLSFKTWYIAKFLLLSKRLGKIISNKVIDRDLKIKNKLIEKDNQQKSIK